MLRNEVSLVGDPLRDCGTCLRITLLRSKEAEIF